MFNLSIIFPISKCPRCENETFIVKAPIQSIVEIEHNNKGEIIHQEIVDQKMKQVNKQWYCKVCRQKVFKTTDCQQR